MTAWYNENDEHAADWLENLIKMGEIAPGIVDRRSIEDVRPDELSDFTQCHFFAGIGIWSRALRNAGWEDDRRVWTGSCPCQPFSASGEGKGFSDPRHLWPAWGWHIKHGKSREIPVLGEQVASKDGLAWLDLVFVDMEASGHALWPFDLCSAGFGSPNIRQRLYFAGLADTPGSGIGAGLCDREPPGQRRSVAPDRRCDDGMGNAGGTRGASGIPDAPYGQEGHTEIPDNGSDRLSGPDPGRPETGRVADPCGARTGGNARGPSSEKKELRRARGKDGELVGDTLISSRPIRGPLIIERPSPLNGFWRNADWLFCRDGKWRPVEPGTFPLVNGDPFKLGSGGAFEGKSRAQMLKGYGNAINLEVATGFVLEVMAEIG